MFYCDKTYSLKWYVKMKWATSTQCLKKLPQLSLLGRIACMECIDVASCYRYGVVCLPMCVSVV